MKKEYQQHTDDVKNFISESIEQLVDRQVTNALNMAVSMVTDKFKNIYKLLDSTTGKEIYYSANAKTYLRVHNARQACWKKLGALNEVTGMLLELKDELTKK